MNVSKTGIWDLKTANSHGGHKHDETLMLKILELYKPNRIADIGCGDGWYCSQFKKNGYKLVHGFEGSWDMIKNGVFDEIFLMDLSKMQLVQDKYDLVLCLEVGEHIPNEFEQTFIDNIASFCEKELILSWAIPNQNGRGHVNERSLEYVQSEMIKRNFKVDESKTQSLRSSTDLKWLKTNVTAYRL